MEKILFALFVAVWTCGLATLLCTVGFWFAAASQILPGKKNAYGWNPLNATINPENLTERGQIHRKRALHCLILFLALTITPLIIGFVVKLTAMIASSLK